MDILHAILLGVIEGITEFLPISSTGHLTIAERLLGYDIADPALTAFTAFIQIGATLATILYFRKDIVRVSKALIRGVKGAERDNDYRLGVGVIVGTIPIAIVGLAFKDQIETTLRSLWIVAIGLFVWSIVMYLTERHSKQDRSEKQITWKDTLFVGLLQCLALVPGVSRSGATISASFMRGFDRVTATRLSFYLSIPALMAAGIMEAVTKADEIGERVGWASTAIATIVSFIVGYLAVAWMLKFIAGHTFRSFIVYRMVLAVCLMVLLTTGVL